MAREMMRPVRNVLVMSPCSLFACDFSLNFFVDQVDHSILIRVLLA